MPKFPYLNHHFGVYFLFPKFQFEVAFASVSGLDFGYTPESLVEGGIAGFTHALTNRGSFGNLELQRGFSGDKKLYEWCEKTSSTMKTEPCDILVSLLDKKDQPVKNWLIFHAIPTSWTAGGLDASQATVMMENVKLTYQNFILI